MKGSEDYKFERTAPPQKEIMNRKQLSVFARLISGADFVL